MASCVPPRSQSSNPSVASSHAKGERIDSILGTIRAKRSEMAAWYQVEAEAREKGAALEHEVYTLENELRTVTYS